MNLPLRKWLKVSLFNLMLVACIGVVLRYKIAYSLPFVDQKFLLEGHSHFAFAGWVTQALMALMVGVLSEQAGGNFFPRYRWMLYANLITAFGMLLSFPAEGYGAISIVFSMASIFTSYGFAYMFLRDLKRLPNSNSSHPWFKVALLSNVVSSIGPYTLAYMMASKNIHQNFYLSSVYFFLHFQYNGWFFFACMGLMMYQIEKQKTHGEILKRVYALFALALIPAYFLSVLWWPIPVWLYIIVLLASLSQILGWAAMIMYIRKKGLVMAMSPRKLPRTLFLLSGVALSIKLLLQAGSVIPSLSTLAFGFRPIVIGYLHLIFLGIITLFLLAYCTNFRLININSKSLTGIIIFSAGIFLNEILLMIQGVSDLSYRGVPFIDQLLLLAAVFLFSGIATINYGQFFSEHDPDHKLVR